jgi:SAM-dependent methyltransferase
MLAALPAEVPCQADGIENSLSPMSSITSQIQFGKNATNYATSHVHKSGPSLPVLIELADPRPEDIVLDVATGTGHTAIALAPLVKKVTGLDLTSRMLEEARGLAAETHLANATFMEGSAEELPFPDGIFSLITSRHAPHHFRHADRFLKEVKRTLKQAGRFVMSDQISPSIESIEWIDFWERTRDPSHFRQRTVDEWRSLAAEAGLRWVEDRIVPYRLEFDWWVRTAGANRYVIAALENHAAAADAALQKIYGLEFDEKGRVKSFHEPMLVVRLEP